jgi:hypothetical protein
LENAETVATRPAARRRSAKTAGGIFPTSGISRREVGLFVAIVAFVLLAVGCWMFSNSQIEHANKIIEDGKERWRKESRAEWNFDAEAEKITGVSKYEKADNEQSSESR